MARQLLPFVAVPLLLGSLSLSVAASGDDPRSERQRGAAGAPRQVISRGFDSATKAEIISDTNKLAKISANAGNAAEEAAEAEDFVKDDGWASRSAGKGPAGGGTGRTRTSTSTSAAAEREASERTWGPAGGWSILGLGMVR